MNHRPTILIVIVILQNSVQVIILQPMLRMHEESQLMTPSIAQDIKAEVATH